MLLSGRPRTQFEAIRPAWLTAGARRGSPTARPTAMVFRFKEHRMSNSQAVASAVKERIPSVQSGTQQLETLRVLARIFLDIFLRVSQNERSDSSSTGALLNNILVANAQPLSI